MQPAELKLRGYCIRDGACVDGAGGAQAPRVLHPRWGVCGWSRRSSSSAGTG